MSQNDRVAGAGIEWSGYWMWRRTTWLIALVWSSMAAAAMTGCWMGDPAMRSPAVPLGLGLLWLGGMSAVILIGYGVGRRMARRLAISVEPAATDDHTWGERPTAITGVQSRDADLRRLRRDVGEPLVPLFEAVESLLSSGDLGEADPEQVRTVETLLARSRRLFDLPAPGRDPDTASIPTANPAVIEQLGLRS